MRKIQSRLSTDIVNLFPEIDKEKWEDGEIMYVLKNLELIGLIDRNSKMGEISYTNTYYQKEKYRKHLTRWGLLFNRI